MSLDVQPSDPEKKTGVGMEHYIKVIGTIIGLCYGIGWFVSTYYRSLLDINANDYFNERFVIVGVAFMAWLLPIAYVAFSTVKIISDRKSFWDVVGLKVHKPLATRVSYYLGISVLFGFIYITFLYVTLYLTMSILSPLLYAGNKSLGYIPSFYYHQVAVLLLIAGSALALDIVKKRNPAYNATYMAGTLCYAMVIFTHTVYQDMKQSVGGGHRLVSTIAFTDRIRSFLEENGVKVSKTGTAVVLLVYEGNDRIFIKSTDQDIASIEVPRSEVVGISYFTK